jgi:hypothetical protein
MTPKLQLSILFAFLALFCGQSLAAEPKLLLEEPFTEPLSADWFWQLGTWKANDGVLRGFESGPRRHGPVKLRRLAFAEADIRFEFRLEGKASNASFPINGTRERGHILNFVVGRTECRIIAHVKKGESIDLVRDRITLAAEREWHPVRIVLKGESITVEFNDRTWTTSHPAAAEPKDNFGLGGGTGGPEGEKAGAVEFRKLRITTPQ